MKFEVKFKCYECKKEFSYNDGVIVPLPAKTFFICYSCVKKNKEKTIGEMLENEN